MLSYRNELSRPYTFCGQFYSEIPIVPITTRYFRFKSTNFPRSYERFSPTVFRALRIKNSRLKRIERNGLSQFKRILIYRSMLRQSFKSFHKSSRRLITSTILRELNTMFDTRTLSSVIIFLSLFFFFTESVLISDYPCQGRNF